MHKILEDKELAILGSKPLVAVRIRRRSWLEARELIVPDCMKNDGIDAMLKKVRDYACEAISLSRRLMYVHASKPLKFKALE